MAQTAIVGGGAAGFFLAITLKERCPTMSVTIYESGQRVLRKVELSGGGRCNVTNTFASVSDLRQVYPRGHRLMGRLLRRFSQDDAWLWFERHGVGLVAQADGCVFPASQDAHTITTLFMREARRLGIDIITGRRITSLADLSGYDYICITTGGQPRMENLLWMEQEVVTPVPSLFSLAIGDSSLTALAGMVIPTPSAEGMPNAGGPLPTVLIPSAKFRATGELLVTHWGLSGPAILRLSSYAARYLHDADYQVKIIINWLSTNDGEALTMVADMMRRCAQRFVTTVAPAGLPLRLWAHLATKAIGTRVNAPWGSLNAKEQRRIANILIADEYATTGRAPHRDEFVTAGGIALSAVDSNTLESRTHRHLYFAGEVLDIDGVTGGFNFQAAWTTAYTVAEAIGK